MGKYDTHVLRGHAVVPDSWPCMAPSAQLPHPSGDGPPNLVGRIFLDVMAPRDLDLGQRWQPADEGEILVVGEDRTGLGPEERLGTPLVENQSAEVGDDGDVNKSAKDS